MKMEDRSSSSDNSEVVKESKGENLEVSNTNLIVNYLPPTMTQEKFHTLFNAIGIIKNCRLMMEKGTGRSLGYGFVDFENSLDSQYAIDILDGLKMENKNIKVSYARPTTEFVKCTNLYISGIPKPMTQQELENVFSSFGKIITSRILYEVIPFAFNQEITVSRGIGFIRFSSREEAEVAIEQLNGTKLKGSSEPITVKFANTPKAKTEPMGFPQPNSNMQYKMTGMNPIRNPNAFPSARSDLINQTLSSLNMNIENTDRIGGLGGPIHHQNNRIRFSPLSNDFVGSPAPNNGSNWSIYVSNLPESTEENALWKLFGPFGAISNVKVITNPETHKCKGIAFVNMPKYEEATLAIESLNGTMIGDKNLQMSFKTPNFRKINKKPS